MRVYRIDPPWRIEELLKQLGCDAGGVAIMAQKGRVELFALHHLSCGALNILKQDALSVGADVAVPRGVVHCQKHHADAILMATPRQLAALIKKEKKQPFGLKRLAEILESFQKKFYPPPVQIMGVVNANDDSFYPQSRYKEERAIEAMERMIDEGATIIDVGAVSSRPGSEGVAVEEELARLRPIFRTIAACGLAKRVALSIDSYQEAVVKEALACGFSIVNDITGLANQRLGALAAAHGARYVIMHMQGEPKTMQHDPYYEDVVAQVDQFFQERLERAFLSGLDERAMILDVGIGFGKRLEDNLRLIKHLAHFQRFGCPLLIGASRKSMIDHLIPTPIDARLPGTLAIHIEAVRRGVSIVRCHDVAAHRQALTLWEAIETTL